MTELRKTFLTDEITGDTASVNTDGQLHTVLRGKLDTGNSTTANLGIDEVFTGVAIDTLDFSALTITVSSDQDSATDGLEVQYSIDGADWHDGELYTIKANTSKFYTPTLQSRYMRVVYTNGGVATTDFHIHTTLRKSPVKWSSHNIVDPIKDEDDAELMKSIITGKRADGAYDNVSLTNGGNMKVSLEEYETGIISSPLPVRDTMLEIAKGNITGHSVVNKFGQNALCGSTHEEIWDGNVAYVWPTTASITHIRTATDTPAMDGMVVEIQGLDTNYDLVIQTKAIDAATSTATEVALDTPLRRVFRMRALSSLVTTDPIWVGATGMSATTASAIIQTGNNQTLMAIYTVPAGKTAYMTNYYATANPTVAAGSLFEVRLWARDNVNGYAPQLKHTQGLDKDATSGFRHAFSPYYKFTEKTDIFLTGQAGTSTVSISAGFDLIVVDN